MRQCEGVAVTCCSMMQPEGQIGMHIAFTQVSEEQQLTSMPQMTMPGTTSRVLLTTASSAVFMSRAAMPGMPVLTMPSFCNLFTPAAAQDASDAKSLWACILDTYEHCVRSESPCC